MAVEILKKEEKSVQLSEVSVKRNKVYCLFELRQNSALILNPWVKVFSFKTEFCFKKKNCYIHLHIKYSQFLAFKLFSVLTIS